MKLEFPLVPILVLVSLTLGIGGVIEAGRAGRNGEDATSVVFWCPGDLRVAELSGLVIGRRQQTAAAQALAFFRQSMECRRLRLFRYFGEQIHQCGRCDVCCQSLREPITVRPPKLPRTWCRKCKLEMPFCSLQHRRCPQCGGARRTGAASARPGARHPVRKFFGKLQRELPQQ